MEELSMIKAELLDQYKRCIESINTYEKEIEEKCVKGYISKKTIKGRKYHYLQWVDNGKIMSKYIKPNYLETIENSITLRKKYENNIKIMKKSAKEIEKFIGKDTINKYLKI